MSYASINDIWTPKKSDKNEEQSKETILSLITNCISKLDKSLDVPQNIFNKLKFIKFDKQKTKVLSVLF